MSTKPRSPWQPPGYPFPPRRRAPARWRRGRFSGFRETTGSITKNIFQEAFDGLGIKHWFAGGGCRVGGRGSLGVPGGFVEGRGA